MTIAKLFYLHLGSIIMIPLSLVLFSIAIGTILSILFTSIAIHSECYVFNRIKPTASEQQDQ